MTEKGQHAVDPGRYYNFVLLYIAHEYCLDNNSNYAYFPPTQQYMIVVILMVFLFC